MKANPLTADNWSSKEIEEARSLDGPILIVGASGFVGAKMYYSLANIRDDVYVISKHAKQSWRLAFANMDHIINLDILDFEALKEFIDNLKPKTIFNFSAYGAYSRQTDTRRIYQTNYIGVSNLISALQDSGCSAFVQAGSSSEYGLNCQGPKETDELSPNSDYSVSKIGVAYMLKYYGKFFNFPGVNLRLYSIYGPFEERDRLVPNLVSHCLDGEYPNLVNKDISRDFVYIDDCNSAFVKAALTACKTNPGISINIATGKKTTLETVAQTAKKVFKLKSEPVFGSMASRKWDLTDWYGDPSCANNILGWKARTDFEHGLKLTADWEKKSSELLKHVSVPVKEKKITAIFACYKDNQAIPVMYERTSKVLKDSGYDYEIIFVNDGSPADDEKVINRISASDNHVIGISHSRNFGSQSAFISGMEVSSGDAVVLMDGDGQDPPEVIEEFIKKWEEGYDIVYGQRVKRIAPLYMQLFYKLFYRIFKKLSDIKIPVDAGDFSLIDKRAVVHMLNFTEKDIFLRGLRAWVGFKQIGVPYERPERLFGKSTNNFQKNIWWAKKGIFSFSTKPLYYIQAIGSLFFVFTMGLGVYYLINYILYPPKDAPGITTIILLVLMLGSIQLISLSIVGDYVGKIMEEVKNRPKFIRNKIIYSGTQYITAKEVGNIIEELKNSKQ
ncbi:MAG: NAD-dependent epimerase/dehydratase family protein [Candidatus Saccharibacteria bacterium]